MAIDYLTDVGTNIIGKKIFPSPTFSLSRYGSINAVFLDKTVSRFKHYIRSNYYFHYINIVYLVNTRFHLLSNIISIFNITQAYLDIFQRYR